MTLHADIDRQGRGTRKRFFNTLHKHHLRQSGPVLVPLSTRPPHSVPCHSALRALLLIALPLCYFVATLLSLSTDAQPGGPALRFPWRPGEHIPLLEAPVARASRPAPQVASVGIVAACKGRHDALARVLPSWLRLAAVKQVVLVDWDSSPPLLSALAPALQDRRVRVVRVDGEPHWVLSRAYNLAVSLATTDWIVRLDCDSELRDGFLAAHFTRDDNASDAFLARPSVFWAGRWQRARSSEEVHLNGAALLRRSDFRRAHGYDERVQTYGWDDEDLFARLQRLGLNRLPLDYDYVSHVPHGDALRSGNGDAVSPEVSIEFNALLLRHLPPWQGPHTKERMDELYRPGMKSVIQLSSYERVSGGLSARRHVFLRTLSRPPDAASLVSEADRESAWALALGRRLHDAYGLCWDLMSRMDGDTRELLLAKLVQQTTRREGGAETPPRMLVVHAMHGLGNRLRSLGSALAFARATRRVAIVVWEADHHCNAQFSELFERRFSYGEELVVVDGIGLSWPFASAGQYDAAWQQWRAFNYMERDGSGARKDEAVAADEKLHVYFKGAYVMQTIPGRLGGWDAANRELRKLVAVQVVRDAVQRVSGALGESVGVHIRHLDTRADIATVDAQREYGAHDAAVIDYWRAASAPKALVSGARLALAELAAGRGGAAQAVTRVFVAGDSAAAAAEVRLGLEGLGWTLESVGAADGLGCSGAHGRSGRSGRSAACLRLALAELVCLSRTRVVLGSMWSSFSEAAARLGAPELRLAGVDFGAAAAESESEVAARWGAEVAAVVRRVRERRGRRNRRMRKRAV